MNHFELQGGELTCEDVPLAKIAEAVGTPVYVYSSATLERHYTVLAPAASVASRTSYGGTAPDQVRAQIRRWKEILA